MALSKHGNKLHIYSLLDIELKYCFYFGALDVRILDICFDKKSKYLALFNSALELNVINLKTSDDNLCQCDDHEEDCSNEVGNESPHRSGFFSDIFTSLKVNNICNNNRLKFWGVILRVWHIIKFQSTYKEDSVRTL